MQHDHRQPFAPRAGGLQPDDFRRRRGLLTEQIRLSVACPTWWASGIVALAAALRLRTVAEGVETWEEAFFLRAAGVDCGQGWFWSKAVSAPEASRILNEGYPLSQARPD